MPTRYVYVIRLDNTVLKIKRFREENPNYIEGKPCVYVGSTGKTPDERFINHKNGIKAARYVRKYGLYLMRRKCIELGDVSTNEAETAERVHAARLRKKGYAVWQN